MALRIFTNLPSQNSQRAMTISSARLGSAIERIATGIRLQRSGDDIGAMSVSESLRGDVTALKQGAKNLNDGISMIQMADGALNEQSSILIRLRELASQAATGTVGSTERATIQLEFTALRNELDRIAQTTEFNGQKLIEGSLASSVTSSGHILVQVGLDSTSYSRINMNTEVDLGAMTSTGLSIHQLSVTSADAALTALEQVNTSIGTLTAGRGKIGAVQNRLVRTISTISIAVENLSAAESAIRDADIAEEVALLTRNQILVQAATAMVGQANLIPQSVLQLLQ